MSEKIVGFITGILVDKYGYPAQDVTPDGPLEDLEFDSLVLGELASLLSRAFEVPIEDEDLAEATTVAEMARAVEARMAEPAAA
jgi:acyl carrier protein